MKSLTKVFDAQGRNMQKNRQRVAQLRLFLPGEGDPTPSPDKIPDQESGSNTAFGS